MVTIRKLAALAGVSHMAVWRTLQQQPGVNPQVRARILALAEAHHYRPNRLVEGLLTGKTRTIGLIVEHLTWCFYSRLCDGVLNAALHDRAHVIILNAITRHGEGQLSLLIDQLIEQRVDGIIIFSGSMPVATTSVLAMWSHDIVPVLQCDTVSEKPLDRIATDESRLAQGAVDYLLRQGHQRIGYCGLNQYRARNREMYHTFRTRGLPLGLFLKEAGNLSVPSPVYAEHYLDFFFHQPHPPTAVICYDDKMATQLLLHAQRRGLRVPGDLSILGCANDIIGQYLTPALTSFEQFPEVIGERAYELIQRRRAEGTELEERIPEIILIPPKLVIRESCGAPMLRHTTPVFPSNDILSASGNPQQTGQVSGQVSGEMARLLSVCTGIHSQRELMTKLGLHSRPHFNTSYLIPALRAGYLERTIPDKPHSSRQRYRLTAKGCASIK